MSWFSWLVSRSHFYSLPTLLFAGLSIDAHNRDSRYTKYSNAVLLACEAILRHRIEIICHLWFIGSFAIHTCTHAHSSASYVTWLPLTPFRKGHDPFSSWYVYQHNNENMRDERVMVVRSYYSTNKNHS